MVGDLYHSSYCSTQSQEWYDAPEARKYVHFDEQGAGSQNLYPPSVGRGDSPRDDLSQRVQSHIISQAAWEVQEAMKDLDITRQVHIADITSL